MLTTVLAELDELLPEELEGINVILARAGQRASRGPPSTASSTSSGGGAGAAGALLAGVAGAGRGLLGRPLSLQPRGPPPLVPLEDITAVSVAAIPVSDGDAETEPLVPPAGPPGGPATSGPGTATRRVSLQMPNLAGIAEDPSSPPPSRPARPSPPSQDESSV